MGPSFAMVAQSPASLTMVFDGVWTHAMKKRLLAFAVAASPAVLLAEDAAPTGLSEAVTQLQGAATSTLNTIRPAIVDIVVALFAIVGIGLAFKYIRRFINR